MKRKQPQRRKTKKTATRQPKARWPGLKAHWKRRALLACTAAVIATLVAGAWVDQRVQRRLSALETANLAIIYSAPFDVSGFVGRLEGEPAHRAERIRAALAARRYIEVNGGPLRPGEFTLRSGSLDIITRTFKTASGEAVRSSRASVPLVQQGSSKGPLLLEPQPVSYLGRDDVKASQFTPLAQIPMAVQRAVLAIEDERFYDHFGVDLIGISRALITNVLAMRLVQGGSTLTQQLAKNLLLSPKRTLSRKLLELPTALSLERHLSKDQLLELYLNEVYLGQEGAVALHGVPEASSAFFGKSVADLSIDEAALLAGIIKAPSSYAPRKHPERALERRNVVLAKMRELNFISDAEYAVAVKKPIRVTPQRAYRRVAPYFVTALEAELSKSIDLEPAQSTGLAVHTGLDIGLQECAERAVESSLAKLERAYPRLTKHSHRLEAALLAIEPYSGLIKAYVGGRDFSQSQFDRVSQGVRQIGSTIKPFLYLTAMDGSLNSYKIASPLSILEDRPHAVAVKRQAAWVPENYDKDYRGDVTLRYALENSLNLPAIYVAERVGIPAVKRTAELFGLADRIPAVPALALGALDTTLYKMTAAYAALANSGVHLAPRLFVTAVSEQGERLATADISEKRVADESAVFVLTNIMQGALERGTGKGVRSAGFFRDAAGKTGTSDKSRDAWFVGFTPNLVVGVWIGFDDNSPAGITGGGAAAPLWGDFMRCGSAYFPDVSFVKPRGVTVAEVDTVTRQLATPDCPVESKVREVFVRGTEPERACGAHGGGRQLQPEDSGDHGDRRDIHRREGQSFWDSIFGSN